MVFERNEWRTSGVRRERNPRHHAQNIPGRETSRARRLRGVFNDRFGKNGHGTARKGSKPGGRLGLGTIVNVLRAVGVLGDRRQLGRRDGGVNHSPGAQSP